MNSITAVDPETGMSLLTALVYLGACLCTLAVRPWPRYLWAACGKYNAVHAAWYDEEIRPQIEADGGIGKLAHLVLRAKLIERRRDMEDEHPKVGAWECDLWHLQS